MKLLSTRLPHSPLYQNAWLDLLPDETPLSTRLPHSPSYRNAWLNLPLDETPLYAPAKEQSLLYRNALLDLLPNETTRYAPATEHSPLYVCVAWRPSSVEAIPLPALRLVLAPELRIHIRSCEKLGCEKHQSANIK